MNLLRWLLGGSATLIVAGWIVFFILANSFRGSFGASENPAWVLVLPLVVALLIVFSTLLPYVRMLLFVTAAAVVAASLGALWIAGEAPYLVAAWFVYAVACIVFISMALRRPREQPS
jgi:hypothetical protein